MQYYTSAHLDGRPSRAAIDAAAEHLRSQSVPAVVWNSDDMHYSDGGPLTVQYLFVLDALNFCFWPGKLSGAHLYLEYR